MFPKRPFFAAAFLGIKWGKMFNSFEVLRYITLFRTCWIGGRYGGGKSALAVHLALQLIAEGHCTKVAANMPLHLGVAGRAIEADEVQALTDVAIILDEGWNQLGKGSDNHKLKMWLAYLRKRNQYVLMPSVLDLARQLMVFTIERRFNFIPLGLSAWLYQWRLRTGGITKRSEQTGYFVWSKPQAAFAFYDHIYESREIYHVYELS